VEISSDHQIMILRSFCEGKKNGGNALPIPKKERRKCAANSGKLHVLLLAPATQMVAGGLNL
jgi:hypothetical protein